jgi:hypothetical protein
MDNVDHDFVNSVVDSMENGLKVKFAQEIFFECELRREAR